MKLQASMIKKIMMLQDGQFIKHGLRNPKKLLLLAKLHQISFAHAHNLKVEVKLHDPEFVLTASGTKFKYQLTSFELFTKQMSVVAKTTMELFKHQAVRPFS